MTDRDQIIAWAREAGGSYLGRYDLHQFTSAELQALVRIVAAHAVDAAIVGTVLPEAYDIINAMLAANGPLYQKDLSNRARKLLPSKYEQSFAAIRGRAEK